MEIHNYLEECNIRETTKTRPQRVKIFQKFFAVHKIFTENQYLLTKCKNDANGGKAVHISILSTIIEHSPQKRKACHA